MDEEALEAREDKPEKGSIQVILGRMKTMHYPYLVVVFAASC